MSNRPKVLSFNHDSRRFEYKRIVAVRTSSTNRLVRVVSGFGSEVRSTADHRICYNGEGYKAANLLGQWDSLTTNNQTEDVRDLFKPKKIKDCFIQIWRKVLRPF
jgi:hypothetical protein